MNSEIEDFNGRDYNKIIQLLDGHNSQPYFTDQFVEMVIKDNDIKKYADTNANFFNIGWRLVPYVIYYLLKFRS